MIKTSQKAGLQAKPPSSTHKADRKAGPDHGRHARRLCDYMLVVAHYDLTILFNTRSRKVEQRVKTREGIGESGGLITTDRIPIKQV